MGIEVTNSDGSIFQSTLPRGERRASSSSSSSSSSISIHAPTRGATRCWCMISTLCGFQSTLPRGERQSLHSHISPVDYISIHAPTRGATADSGFQLLLGEISIHAPTRGATSCPGITDGIIIFQSTLPRGERHQFSPKSSLFSQQKLSKIFNLNNKLF